VLSVEMTYTYLSYVLDYAGLCAVRLNFLFSLRMPRIEALGPILNGSLKDVDKADMTNGISDS
jgi:hypothetical protein